MEIEKICEKCGKIRYFWPQEIKNRSLRFCKNCKGESISTHGDSRTNHKTRLYKLWCSMKRRCGTPSDSNYSRYGAKGIYVCDLWLNFEPFKKWSLENGYSDDLSIDRINNNLGYSSSNCRWVTRHQQARNTTVNKLNMEDAKLIRKLYASGEYTHKKIAIRYNVHSSLIGLIVRNKSWVENV